MSYSAVGAELLPSTFPSSPSRTVTFPSFMQLSVAPPAPAPQLPSCVTADVHLAAVKQCQNLAVKGVGLGVVGYEQYSSCALAQVPICPTAAPGIMLTAQMQPPVQITPTYQPYVPVPPAYVPPVASSKKNLIVGGILAVLVVGGAVVAYRTFKKKPASG